MDWFTRIYFVILVLLSASVVYMTVKINNLSYEMYSRLETAKL